MTIEIDPAHTQQGTISNLKANGDSCIARFLTGDSNARLRMAQLIQRGANRKSDSLKRRGIGWFS